VKTALLTFLVLASGCALAPGMRMNEGHAVDRGRATTGDESFNVEPITPELISSLARQLASERVLIPDPQASTPPRPYTIAPYDVLQVIVWDHPELTTPTGQFRSPEENGNQVGADGTVFYPYAGIIPVAGKTVAEVRQFLVERLTAVIEKPQLDVRIAAFRGKRVQVTGEVLAPAPMPIMDLPLRVQDAIAWAKGFTPDADLTNVTLTREGKTFQLDLLALYERGDLSQNWLLNDGDVVNIGDRNRNRVFVMGEVKLQQAKLMTKRRMTLAEAIGESGGFDFLAANTSNVYVIRGAYDAPKIYRLDASSADALLLATHFELRPRDIVYVATNELTRWNRVMSQILPTAQTLYDAAIAFDVAKRNK
jgi:polysaccharide export outer membrane protein